MSDKFKNWIFYGSIFGVIAGILTGYYLPGFILSIDFIGSLFINALKTIILPLIVTSLVVGITGLGDLKKLGRTSSSTLLYFFTTTIIAVSIGLVLMIFIKPGLGVSSAGAFIPDFLREFRESGSLDIIDKILPSNIPQAAMGGNYLGIIFISIIFSIVLTTMSRSGKIVVDFFKAINELIYKIINIILIVAPVGLFVLIGTSVARNEQSIFFIFEKLLPFSIVLMGAFLIHGLIVLPLILRIFAKQSVVSNFTHLIPALSTAFSTSSSAATLSITCDRVINHNKVDSRAGSFVLPLGSIINVDATAMYALMAVLFISQMIGIDLTAAQIMLMAFASIVVSFGISGMPFAAMFLLVILLDLGNFPPDAYAAIGLLFIVDWFFDRVRATLNVWSDAIGAAVVGETFDFKTARRRPRTASSRTAKPDDKKYSRSTSSTYKRTTVQKSDRYDSKKDSKPARKYKTKDSTEIRGRSKVSPAKDVVKETRSPFEIKVDSKEIFETAPKTKPAARTVSKPKPKIIPKVPKPPKTIPQRTEFKETRPKTSATDKKKEFLKKDKPSTSTPVKFEFPKPPSSLPYRLPTPPAPKDEAIDTFTLSPKKVEEELSKVAERLAALDKTTDPNETEKIEEITNQSESIAPVFDNSKEAEIDFISEDTIEEELEVKVEEKPEVKPKAQPKEIKAEIAPEKPVQAKLEGPESKSEISFGRKSRKKTPIKDDSAETPAEVAVEDKKQDFDVEKQSFGRSKRKKSH